MRDLTLQKRLWENQTYRGLSEKRRRVASAIILAGLFILGAGDPGYALSDDPDTESEQDRERQRAESP